MNANQQVSFEESDWASEHYEAMKEGFSKIFSGEFAFRYKNGTFQIMPGTIMLYSGMGLFESDISTALMNWNCDNEKAQEKLDAWTGTWAAEILLRMIPDEVGENGRIECEGYWEVCFFKAEQVNPGEYPEPTLNQFLDAAEERSWKNEAARREAEAAEFTPQQAMEAYWAGMFAPGHIPFRTGGTLQDFENLYKRALSLVAVEDETELRNLLCSIWFFGNEDRRSNKHEAGVLSPSEAIFGFAGWLTCRAEPVTMSAKHDAAITAELANQFCLANGLAIPRDRWEKALIHPAPDKSLAPGCSNDIEAVPVASCGNDFDWLMPRAMNESWFPDEDEREVRWQTRRRRTKKSFKAARKALLIMFIIIAVNMAFTTFLQALAAPGLTNTQLFEKIPESFFYQFESQ